MAELETNFLFCIIFSNSIFFLEVDEEINISWL